MQAFLKNIAKLLYTFASAVVKPLLLLPLIAAMVWFNYTVDRSGLFNGDRYEREVALSLLAGNNLTGYEQMDERQINALYVQNMEQAPDTAAIGSSRILQLSAEIAGTEDFYNFGMIGAGFKDLLATFYLFDRADKLPNNLIIGLDPWILSASPNATDYRTDIELYNEFLTTRFGIQTDYEAPDEGALLQALISPSYLQGNVEYYFRDQSFEKKPSVLTGDLYSQVTEVKMSDGAVLYSEEFRDADLGAVESRALESCSSYAHVHDFEELDPTLCSLFDRFIQYVQGKGVNVIFVLTPHHPTLYTYLRENAASYQGFFLAEPWFAEYAQEHNIPLYGSYNPYVAGISESGFYDGLHIKGEALADILPTISTVLAQQKNGQAGSGWLFGGTRVSEETALAIATQLSGISAPHVLRASEPITINGISCYTFNRYTSSSAGAAKAAAYAVSQDEGVFYRYDTRLGQWVNDRRF